MRIAVDCRYVRERPSSIGAYVSELVQRLPSLAPADRFQFWAHRLAPRPLSTSPNVDSFIVTPEPNSLWSLEWPARYAPLHEVDLFHAPHTVLPRMRSLPTVVTIQDLLAIEHPELHRSGLDGLAKR